MKRASGVVIDALPRADGALSVVHVEFGSIVMSTGEILLVKWTKLQSLCEDVCQDRAEVWIRVWTASDGNELIELHRVGELATNAPTDRSEPSEVF